MRTLRVQLSWQLALEQQEEPAIPAPNTSHALPLLLPCGFDVAIYPSVPDAN